MQTNPYARHVNKSNPHILCGAGQPSPYFLGQVRGGLAHIVIPKCESYMEA